MVVCEEDREKALRSALKNIAEVYTAVVPAGKRPIHVHFVNERDHPEGCATLSIGKEGLTPENVDKLVDAIPWNGLSRFGAALRGHVLEPYVYKESKKVEARKLRKIGKMERPLMIMVVTDGQVEGEEASIVPQVINHVKQAATKNPHIATQKAVTYQFTRVGSDETARKYLEKLDDAPVIGEVIDTHPNLDLARIKSISDHDATPQQKDNIMKLMIGAIDRNFDKIDTRTDAERERDGKKEAEKENLDGDGDEEEYEDDLPQTDWQGEANVVQV